MTTGHLVAQGIAMCARSVLPAPLIIEGWDDFAQRGVAVYDAERQHRFFLERDFTHGHTPYRTLLWVMLNPSTAGAQRDDATIRRCVDFSRRAGFDRMWVVNLFSLRSRSPKSARVWLASKPAPALLRLNREAIMMARACADLAVAGWGAHPWAAETAADVLQLIRPVSSLGTTKSGQPGHPLFLPKVAPFTEIP